MGRVASWHARKGCELTFAELGKAYGSGGWAFKVAWLRVTNVDISDMLSDKKRSLGLKLGLCASGLHQQQYLNGWGWQGSILMAWRREST